MVRIHTRHMLSNLFEAVNKYRQPLLSNLAYSYCLCFYDDVQNRSVSFKFSTDFANYKLIFCAIIGALKINCSENGLFSSFWATNNVQNFWWRTFDDKWNDVDVPWPYTVELSNYPNQLRPDPIRIIRFFPNEKVHILCILKKNNLFSILYLFLIN